MQIIAFRKISKYFDFFHEFDQKYLDSSFAFQVGIFAVGGIIGSFLTKVLTTKFGRKGSQAINMFISIAGAANFIGAYQYSSPGMDYVIMTSSWLYNSWYKDQSADDVTMSIKIHKKRVSLSLEFFWEYFPVSQLVSVPCTLLNWHQRRIEDGLVFSISSWLQLVSSVSFHSAFAWWHSWANLKYKFSWTNYCTSKYYG